MAIAAPTQTPATSTTVKPGGASPIENNVSGQPTFPEGSVVNSGNGPVVTPPSDNVLYTRVGNDAPVSTPPAKVTGSIPATNQQSQLFSGAQAAVDATNKEFDTKIQNFTSGAGASNVGSQNSIAALLGLSGGSGAQDRLSVAGKGNQKVTDAYNQQRSARINSIYNSLSKSVSDLNAANAKTDAGNQKTYTADTAKEAKTALTNISGVLGNLSYQQFKSVDPQTYQKILDLSGGDEASLELLYNSTMNSSANKPTYHWENGQAFEQVGGNISRRPDLDTKTPSAANGSTKLQVIGGEAYLFPTDSAGKTNIDPAKPLSYYAYASIPKNSATPKPKAPSTPLTGTEYSKLNSNGIDQKTADAITTAILGGQPLDQIREDMKNEGVDPSILNTYDRTVGIAKILKNQKPSTKAAPTSSGIPGVTQ